MKEPFELEWMGGPAEHHFRKARPRTEELPWGTLDVARYSPVVVDAARGSWTEVAINEYRAVAAFAEVLRALVEAKAPLDLIGMASDFLADEVSHVELASRVAMELGGAAPRAVDMDAFALRANRALTPFERANELVLRVSSVAEAFSAGTGAGNLRVASHPLTRAVYETILADEARHRRLGGLYFEWASDRITDAERERLGHVMASALTAHRPFWKRTPSAVTAGVTADGHRVEHLHELGWMEAALSVPLALEVALNQVVAPLATLGITLTAAEHAELFA